MTVLERELWLPCASGEIFRFFADAHNLEAITPPWLRFRIVTPPPIEMAVGTRIEYRLRLHGVPVGWESEITRWDPPYGFVDEQRRGPYRRWVHAHAFEERNGGTLVSDRVEYEVPGGALADRLLVRRDLGQIFDFRRDAIVALLGENA